MGDFRSTNKELASFVVSVYLIGYCFGPLVIAPLSEIYGRSPLYHTCNIMFVILSVACALSPNLASLIIFRFFAGFAGSCPMTLGPGTLADIVSIERRGQIMAAWVSGPLLGPVIGPIGKKTSGLIHRHGVLCSLTGGNDCSGWVFGSRKGLALGFLGGRNYCESKPIGRPGQREWS